MNLMPKHINPTLLLLSAFLTLSIYSRDLDNIKVGKIHASIREETEEIAKNRKSPFAFLQDVFVFNKDRLTQALMVDYSGQRYDFLVRQYTGEYMSQFTSRPLDKKWRYKTEDKEKHNDKAATLKAYKLWNQDNTNSIRKHANKRLAQYYDKRDKSLFRKRGNSMLTTFMEIIAYENYN